MASKWLTVIAISIVVTSIATLTSCLVVTKEYKLDMACKLPTDCDNIMSVARSNENETFYLATKNTLKQLDNNLNIILDRKIHTNGSNIENSFMLIRGLDLILCMNDGEGRCELWDASTLDKTSEGHNRTTFITQVEGSKVAWISKGNMDGSDYMNIAISTTYQKPALWTTPLVATRILPQRNESQYEFLAYLEDSYGSPKSFLNPIPCVTTEIEPVYGFSTSRFNYLLKRHRTENGWVETKLARTCKDSPTYRSYIELPIECQSENEEGDPTNSELSAAYFTNGELHAVFTTTSDTQMESIVCMYNINKIDRQFTERRRECLLGKTETTEIDWYQYNTCPSKPVPSSKFNISRLDDPDFCYDLDTAHPLGGSRPIVEKRHDFVKLNAVVTAMIVIPTDDGEVYILGDKEGYLHMISSKGEREVQPIGISGALLSQNGLILSNGLNTVYATSSTKIAAVSLSGTLTTAETSTQRDTQKTPKRKDEEDNDGVPFRASFHYACIAGFLVFVLAH